MNKTNFLYITQDKEFQKLKAIPRHGCTNTFAHSEHVAAYAAQMASFFKVSPESAYRTALLHDFCLANYTSKSCNHPGFYCFYHPIEAAQNAKRFGLSAKELRAIECHMFPLGPIPTSRLGWLIRIADIVASITETECGIRCIQHIIKNGGYKTVA